MAIEISRAEAWTRAHEVFTRVNFNAFDYNTIKDSLLDYTKLYFPEDFNDFIESSEFIAILELFAYVGEILAYRLDVNAHENFITTAERKESILRLAKLISYKVSRNIAARGLVKISSIQTTEQVVDSHGRNLANVKVIWNDLNNPDWKEQFLLIMNRVLEQDFGSIAPNERAQIEDVLFELYTLNNQPLKGDGVTTFNYSAASTGTAFPMELVPVKLTDTSPVEKRPERNAKMSLLYGSDGLGDGSDTTGFFFFTKQGTLQLRTESFDGVTPNQTYDIDVSNINETDIWLNNVNPGTRDIVDVNPYADIMPHLERGSGRYGEWSEVDLANAQNILFNTNKNRQKFEIETLDDDKARIVFGDGEFTDIPLGDFDIWYRTSANSDSSIQKSAVIDQSATFTYLDLINTAQTFKFTFTLINSLQNGSMSEDIEHIRRVAPSVYYTQDRMVNGRDYNSFMLQDPSILKLQAVNRTFAGDSKYISWHDPKEYYENVKIFGEDLALFWIDDDINSGGSVTVNTALTSNEVLTNLIEPLLSTTEFDNKLSTVFAANDIPYATQRDSFTAAESIEIIAALDTASTSANPQVDIYISVGGSPNQVWSVTHTTGAIHMIRVEAQFTASALNGWTVLWVSQRMVAQSQSTKFRHSNNLISTIDATTLNSNMDNITVLRANMNGNDTGVLTENKTYMVLGQELVAQNLINAGIPDDNRLTVLPIDANSDLIPDDLVQSELYYSTEQFSNIHGVNVGSPETTNHSISLNNYYMDGTEDDAVLVKFGLSSGSPTSWVTVQYDESATIIPSWQHGPDTISTNAYNSIVLTLNLSGSPIEEIDVDVTMKRHVLFSRASGTDTWVPLEDDTAGIYREAWYLDQSATTHLYKRQHGRYPLNFAWFYTTPRFHLVDPTASNIIDMFIITAGYYESMTRWLENKTDVRPDIATPLDLRTAYNGLLQNRMISDTVILQSGIFKILFGSRAIPELQTTFKVIRPVLTNITDNEAKVKIVEVIRAFFVIDDWDFGSTFFFTELAASIHAALGSEINSIVLVPSYNTTQFGDLFQVQSRENEIFIPDITTEDIEIIQSFTAENIRQ